MKLRVEADGIEYLLDYTQKNDAVEYTLASAEANASGTASVLSIGNDAYSLLLGTRSFTVRVVPGRDGATIHVNGRQFHALLADARDRQAKNVSAEGPVELRSQMPGKIVKLLVEVGQVVVAAQPLVVVEAMKMQNEIAAPKSGTVERIAVVEGAIVGAGEALLTVV